MPDDAPVMIMVLPSSRFPIAVAMVRFETPRLLTTRREMEGELKDTKEERQRKLLTSIRLSVICECDHRDG